MFYEHCFVFLFFFPWKKQDFQLEVQCFHIRDEGAVNFGEQSERESEKEELEREIHPGNFRNSIWLQHSGFEW